MRKLILFTGYFFIILSCLTLIIELIPFELSSKIAMFIYSLFYEPGYHDIYVKVVPSTDSYILVAIEMLVGFTLIMYSKKKQQSK